MMELRPYQNKCRESVNQAWKTYRKILTVLPTGCGKTCIFSFIARDIVATGGRVLILANRNVLLVQARDKLRSATGLEAALEQGDETAHDAMEGVVVGSVQTLMNLSRLERYSRTAFTHIIVDEADLCIADSFQRILSYFETAKVLGVTATTKRGDRRDLGEFFESIAYEYPLPQAVADGWLVPMTTHAIPLSIALPNVGKRDWNDLEVGDALAPYIPQIADELWKRCHDRKLLVFAPLCAISRTIREALTRVGFRGYYADGEYLDEMDEWYKAEHGASMTNAMLLSRGYDCTNIDAVCILRPTKNETLIRQMYGRGTRPLEEIARDLGNCPDAASRRAMIRGSRKPNLYMPDFLFHCDHINLCSPACLYADNEDIAAKMAERIIAGGGEGEPTEIDEEALAEAKAAFLADKERVLSEKLAEQRRKKGRLVDPLQFAVSAGDEAAVAYEPAMAADRAVPTLEQLRDIEQFGVSTEGMSAGLAARTLETLRDRYQRGLAMPKHIRLLERPQYGFLHAAEFTKGQAGTIINRIKANAWRMPDGLIEERDKWNKRHA